MVVLHHGHAKLEAEVAGDHSFWLIFLCCGERESNLLVLVASSLRQCLLCLPSILTLTDVQCRYPNIELWFCFSFAISAE